MYPGSLLYALPLLGIAGLTGGIGIYAFQRPKHPGAIIFGWLMMAMTLWSAIYALEILAPTLPDKILAGKLEYMGIASTPVLWLVFALEYTGHAGWLTRSKRSLLIAFPSLTFGLTLTNEFHSLIWKKTSLDPQGFPSMVVIEHGVWFWIHTAFSYSLILAGIILYLAAFFQAHHLFRQQMSVMVTGSIVPLFLNAITLFFPIPLHGLDLTPFTFAFSGIFLAIGLFRLDLLNLMPVAAPLVIENLRDAIIVVDENKRLVNLNSAGRIWLKVGEEAIGCDARKVLSVLDPIWQYWEIEGAHALLESREDNRPRWFDLTISPLRDTSKHLLGRVIIAHDISREQTLLFAERNHARQMELLNSITRASLETTAFHEMLQILADQLGGLLEADGAFITLWNETQQKTIPAAAYGELREMYPTIRFESKETSLTESVLSAGHSLAVEDVFNTPYMSPGIAARFPSHSILALPLIAHGQKLGAALIAFNQPHHFTEEETVIGEQAAAQIALALNKAQLLDAVSHRVVQLGLLQVVSNQMAESLDEMEIFQHTVESIVNLFGYSEADISLLTEDNQLEMVAINGAEEKGLTPGFRQNVGQGIVGYIAETRKPYFTNDIAHDPHYYHPSRAGSGSAMGTPMLHEGKMLGVIYVQSARPEAIIEGDLQTLQTLASHLVTAVQKARLYADAHQHLKSMTTLQSITETMASSLELDTIFTTVVQLLKKTYGYGYVSIYLLEDATLRLGAQAGYPEELVLYEIPISTGISGRAIRTRQIQYIRNVKNNPIFLAASHEVDSEICVPLLKNDNVLGVLNIEATSSRPLTEIDVDLLTALASPVAIAIDNARLHAKVTSLALTDGMTGLVNRRAFDQILETEIARSARYGHALSLIIVDMDSFKEYNDTFGHPAGDERLKAIAGLLLGNVRDPDVAARYGGEEFAIILPHTTKEGAMMLAERIRASAEAQSPEKPGPGKFAAGYTISMGVAAFPEDGNTPSTLLLAADNAEMTAKRLGKNRVCAAGISEEPVP